jgi:adenine-specific DNA-methyltransferase
MPQLTWVGKDKVKNHHHDVPFRLLNTQYTFTANEGTPANSTGNKIIHGDNLEALKSLLPEFEGKVNCIYIDPPYNTGNEGWVYNDNVNDPKIKKWLGLVVGKEGEDLSRHDKWLCMMYPRLKLLHRLLADDGVIFISIDDNEQAHLKLVMDEVFGASKFISDIAVINNLKGRSDDKYIATAHEHLLIYKKNSFETNGIPVPEEYLQEYKFMDERGAYRLQGLRKRGSGSKRSDRPNMFYPFYVDIVSNSISLDRKNDTDFEVFPKLSDGSDGRWRWGKETVQNRLHDLLAEIVKTRHVNTRNHAKVRYYL